MATEPESVLAFVTRHYDELKAEAKKDNESSHPKQEEVTDVIALIDKLYETINNTTGDISHEKIVEQLKALKTQYNTLGLTDPYTRYIDANASLNMIVGGLEEVDAGVGSKGKGKGEG